MKGTPDVKLFSKPMALALLCKYLLKAFVYSVSIPYLFLLLYIHDMLFMWLLELVFILLDKEQAMQTAAPHHGCS